MARAIELAAMGVAYGPNPRVGCVIVAGSGEVIGEGFHHGAGLPHAEVEAVAAAERAGHSVTGATAFVTLEPCSHTGRTPPCTDLLKAKGIGAVVFAVPDPNPVAAGGAEVLAAAGILATLEPNWVARELNRHWLHSVTHGRPYVIAKWAATLDGRIAAADGTSQWITGADAREHAHYVRAAVDAIAVGTGTVIADNPSLSARPDGIESAHQPLRVVVGHRDTQGAAVWRDSHALAARTHNPADVLAALHAREVRSLVVEGGAVLVSAFLAAGLVDEVNAYIAPVVLGAGPLAVGDAGIDTIADALRWTDVSVTTLGADTLIRARKEG